MALINVDEIMGDPDFFDNITIIRSSRYVGQDGRTIDNPDTITATGAVTPASGTDLDVLPEAERVGSFIKVLTPLTLYALTDNTAPDIVLWLGKQYQVKHVEYYTHYGAGFVNVVAQLLDYTTAMSP